MAPKPKKMSDADKAYLKRLLKQAKPGKGAMADGSLSMDQKMALSALKRKEKQATAYSPKPMSMRAADKASARGKATQAKVTARKPKAGSGVASKVVSRARIVAREVGDVKKAAKNVAVSGASALNLDRTGNQYLGKQSVRETAKDLKKQLKEAGSAIKSGKPGKRAGTISYNSDTGTPQGLKKRMAPKTDFRARHSTEHGTPYKTGKAKQTKRRGQ